MKLLASEGLVPTWHQISAGKKFANLSYIFRQPLKFKVMLVKCTRDVARGGYTVEATIT